MSCSVKASWLMEILLWARKPHAAKVKKRGMREQGRMHKGQHRSSHQLREGDKAERALLGTSP